ncbi:hypothetical protein HN604_01095 [archaeon]|jgi:hypothetical protein|nr:hypothetical protein [archaeon]MBT6182351.1 hypothetical protein [archaeon]MBT6606484.1 hypothetical protein [archaeon]MBT7251351.1 hypothetical protein [archaeon]MBT7660659.1 hypothetical protein [archaeon]
MDYLYKNKKAVSQIIATVLVIMVTVSARVIVWAAVSPIIRDKLEVSAECRAANSAISIKNFCVIEENPTGIPGKETYFLFVKVSRNSEEINLVDLDFVLENDKGISNSLSFVEYIAGTELEPGSIEDLPGTNQGITIKRSFPSMGVADKKYSYLSIAPIIRISKEDVICPTGRKVRLKLC